MYERFTDEARKAMQLATQEAIWFNHDYVGTEHMLLGLIRQGSGVAASALRNLDVELRKVCAEVEKLVQRGPDKVTIRKLPQTPHTRKAIEYSVEEARQLGLSEVDTEHFLMAIVREPRFVAYQVLTNLRLEPEAVRREVLHFLEDERG